MIIDFIAYHHLQAQAAASVFDKLKSKYHCRWLIGPFNVEPPGEIGLLIDHRCFHNIYKSRRGYKYLFHLSHDIADVDLYKKEDLSDFDLIFVPTIAHYNACLECGYDELRIKLVGWPKYDNIAKFQMAKDLPFRIENGNRLTLLYAPSFASNYEWKKLFPFFLKIGCDVVIKNHIYVDEGQSFPTGQEVEYSNALASVKEMECKALELGFLIIPRTENICNVFDLADILVSDSSSCLLEFLPFGVPVETGGGPSVSASDYEPEASLLSKNVLLLPVDKLAKLNATSFFDLIKVFSLRSETPMVKFGDGYSAGADISQKIIEYIQNYSPRYVSWSKRFISFLKRARIRLSARRSA